MAKLFIGCDYIDFTFGNAGYSGVLSKIILDNKTIFRVDYTSFENQQTGRYEAICSIDATGNVQWESHSKIDTELAQLFNSEIEKNQAVLLLQ